MSPYAPPERVIRVNHEMAPIKTKRRWKNECCHVNKYAWDVFNINNNNHISHHCKLSEILLN